MVGQKKQLVLFFQQNCICIAALLTVALLYSKVVPVLNREPYSSLIPPQQVRALDCQVISNPVKTGSGKLYRCTVRLQQVQGNIAGNNATHDKVMWESSGGQGEPELKGCPSGPA